MKAPATRPEKFMNYIGPRNLLGLVRNAAPFYFDAPPPDALPSGGRLADDARSPRGWWRVLLGADGFAPADPAAPTAAERVDYFALCLACHHATVATFIPTDVDSKIRGLLWRDERDPQALSEMLSLTLAMRSWAVADVSARFVRLPGHEPVSGHDGEFFSVLTGALGACLFHGLHDDAGRLIDLIDAELRREAAAFDAAWAARDGELDALRLSALLTHNVGDLDQGMSFWPKKEPHASLRARFGRLAHENTAAHGGSFARAALLYRSLMAPEGHRNYPLRGAPALRASRDLLLPMAPFLDDWGAVLATHPALDRAGRLEVLGALAVGTEKIPNQQGYFRALAGMARALGGSFQLLCDELPTAPRKQMRDASLRRHLGTLQASFESGYRKQARALLR